VILQVVRDIGASGGHADAALGERQVPGLAGPDPGVRAWGLWWWGLWWWGAVVVKALEEVACFEAAVGVWKLDSRGSCQRQVLVRI
jgi:hypothetical protein